MMEMSIKGSRVGIFIPLIAFMVVLYTSLAMTSRYLPQSRDVAKTVLGLVFFTIVMTVILIIFGISGYASYKRG